MENCNTNNNNNMGSSALSVHVRITAKDQRGHICIRAKPVSSQPAQSRVVYLPHKAAQARFWAQRRPILPSYEEIEQTYASELAQLKAQGFPCHRRNSRLLWRNQGDMDEVVRILQEKLHRRAEKCQTLNGIESSLDQLHQAGFNCDWVNFRLLKKYEGDLEKTLNKLLDRQQCRMDRKSEPELTFPELLEKFGPQLAVLHSEGFLQDVHNLRLLKKFKGDVDLTVEKLQSHKVKQDALLSRFAQQLEELHEAGFNNDQWNLRLLKKNDGQTDKVLEKLHKWKRCKEFWRNRCQPVGANQSDSSSSSTPSMPTAPSVVNEDSSSSSSSPSSPSTMVPCGLRLVSPVSVNELEIGNGDDDSSAPCKPFGFRLAHPRIARRFHRRGPVVWMQQL